MGWLRTCEAGTWSLGRKKFWAVGNEMYGMVQQLGYMSPVDM